MKNTFKITIMMTIFLLAGCALFAPSGPYAALKIQSVSYLNPDVYGKPSPVVLTVYQLKSSYAFQQADYRALLGNSGKALGTALIDKTSIEVRPGEAQHIDQPISSEATYLGIVAAYRNIDHAIWHRVIKVEIHKSSHPVLQINLQSQGFTASVSYANNYF